MKHLKRLFKQLCKGKLFYLKTNSIQFFIEYLTCFERFHASSEVKEEYHVGRIVIFQGHKCGMRTISKTLKLTETDYYIKRKTSKIKKLA